MAADGAGKLVLRLALGLLILLHGVAKLRFGVGDAGTAVDRVGLPHVLSYLIYVGELVAPALVIVGIWTRAAAAIIAVNMAVALVLGHPGELFRVEPHGGLLLEVQWLYLACAIAIALIGAGRFSVGGVRGFAN
ncbi:MAG TPA: DoxX family protein [Opitutaceae bacterium]|nr:DoxX family protein [Opitutaceae bacterium]